MYGWRARVGLIVPSTNSTIEEEFHRLLPEGISVHTARMFLKWTKEEDTYKAHEKMNEHALEAGRSLATVGPNIIVYGCTGGSFFKGFEYHVVLSKHIEEIAGIKTITTSTAVLSALKLFKIHKLLVVTPYVNRLNEREKLFLEKNGFKIMKIEGLGLLPGNTIELKKRLGTTYPEEV